MRIERRAEHAIGDAAARTATGRTLGEWFAVLDAGGGTAASRRALGVLLAGTHGVDPWWSSTLICEYELARGVLDQDGRPRGYTVCATKRIAAASADCFAAFADARALDAWLGPGHTLDFRVGGRLANADGNRATIRGIVPGKTVRYLWQDPDLTLPAPVEATCQAVGGKTTVMVTLDRLQTRAEADGYRRAWGEALTRLKSVLEAR